MDATKAATTMTPSSVSPVLKTMVNITLSSAFPYTLNKDDFTVNATNKTNTDYVRYLNVIAVDDATKTLSCMFGGAWTGQYSMSVRHSVFGLLDTSAIELTVGSNVTSVSPTSGSIYGGTLLTITGTNFGTEITDNPVQISTLGAVGSVDCFLQSTSATEIKCRVDTNIAKAAGTTGKVVTFLKTSEEAVCAPNAACTWTYTDAIPTVSAVAAEYSNSSNVWTLKVIGTGFTGTTGSVELTVNGAPQTTSSISQTEAAFAISDVTSSTLSGMAVFFDVGLPEGHHSVVANSTLTLTPKLVSISPSSGSSGGSVITAMVAGVGTATTGLDLVDSTGSSICQSVSIVSYGKVLCHTKAAEIAESNISVSLGSTTYACASTTSSACVYRQVTADPFPIVTGASLSSTNDQIVFTGTDFFTSAYSAHASFAGVPATSVSIDSATQVTATWVKGVPVASTSASPSLYFNSSSSEDLLHYASVPAAATVTNTLSMTQSSTAVSCSFAGGCLYEVAATGLASLLASNSSENNITVCGNLCPYSEADSTVAAAKCKLPAMSTVYSNANYLIAQPEDDLRNGSPFGTLADASMVFDDDLLLAPTSPSTTSGECFVGVGFKEGHVGLISQVKYFMGDTADKSAFVNATKFQGSNDNVTFTDLFTVDENVHEGWNYYPWTSSSSYPRYRYYRFYGNSSAACVINEVKFAGVETVDDSGTSYSCSPLLSLNGSQTQLTAQAAYQATLTANLTSISPRFGTVEGGDSVTFTGTGFSQATGDYTITIDGVDCPVTAATATSVTCTTGPRPGLVSSSLEIFINGQGRVSTAGQVFRYVSLWSADSTWGGEYPPMEGESVHVPAGLNLLVDVDRTPVLNLVLVEGAIIFAPNSADATHQRYFDANYVFVHRGYMEVGTEDFPYTSKLTITLHGNVSSPYLPVYGNKVIDLRYGTLEKHGPNRKTKWTA